jgi:arylsulfatase A
MADDIGFECYSCNGSEYYKTPNIDKLAASGARFTHAYSQPICTPSRVKIMTGKHNFRNYVGFGMMDLTQKTFAHSVKEAGYKTCIAGKWQLSPDDLQGPFTSGFDEYCLWHFQGPKMGAKGSRFKSPLMFQNGTKIEDTEGKYGPDYAADFICDFIDRNKENPFMVYYPMLLVHFPFDPTPDSVDWDEKKSKRKVLDRFGDMVTYMDKKIGQIVAKLEAEGLRENTLIMITGDNGTYKEIVSPWPPRNEINGGKGKMIDDGTHVAFVANWPGTIKPGTVVESPIDFSDVFPTITDVTGAPTPSDLDGQSMLPLLKGDESNARGWAFVDYSKSGKPPYRHFIRTERYKLYSDGKLYDIPNDWMEKSPLTSPETDGVRKRLQTTMDEILKDHPTDEEIRQRRAEKGVVSYKSNDKQNRK